MSDKGEKNEKGERQDRRILTNVPISDDIVKICSASYSVSSLLAAHQSMAPGEAWKKLYGTYTRTVGRAETKVAEKAAKEEEEEKKELQVSEADLEKAALCGKWGETKPSELFLRIYHDVLAVIEENPSRAMVSPSLLGSYGTAPLTVISTIPDIVRHMANVIARADKEVFLATNYWQDSTASRYLTNAIRELDHRAGQRKTRVVVKVMYDRGSPKQVIDPHYLVSEAEFTGKNVCLPSRNDLPNTDLQVMNYHQPMVGTFHAKYMVVDRKIAILQSNNIQDNDNLEMMVHFEGPIVDSFYDMALLSWHKKMDPPLPTLGEPAAKGNTGLVPVISASPSGALSPVPTIESVYRTETDDSTVSTATASTEASSTSVSSGDTVPSQESAPKPPNQPNGPDAATKVFLNAGTQPTPQLSIVQPVPPGKSLLQSTSFHPQYDDDIAGEVARVQASVTPKAGQSQIEPITALLNHTTNRITGDAPDFASGEEMTPYIPYLDGLKPFPIAMVNRPPYGTPNHSAVVMPQNAAWLSALKHARKSVFIQSPTLNAEPLVPAIRDACERGLDVICYICLGYNDTGELLPKQGGTNEMIAHQLYSELSEEGKKHLHYFWYIGKDQTRPIPQRRKQRDCHIKLMIVDESIGIQGNGNQDTQSWYHSQEINVMLESPEVCRAWIDGLRRNQNTHIYGTLDPKEGIWRDSDGKEAEFAMGIDPGRFSWAKGLVGAVQRVQGKGGF